MLLFYVVFFLVSESFPSVYLVLVCDYICRGGYCFLGICHILDIQENYFQYKIFGIFFCLLVSIYECV